MFHRTERLFLRPVWAEDAAAIYRGIAEEVIVRNLARAPWPYRMEDAQSYVELPHDPTQPNFGITLAESGEYIGQVGFGPDERGDRQVGYWLARSHWGQGYATEATRGALEVGRMLGFKRIVAAHFLDNPASGKVLRKAGFKATGELGTVYSLARDERSPSAHYAINLGDEDDSSPSGSPDDMLEAA